MDSTRAQLLYDQLLDDHASGRPPSVPFIEAAETLFTSKRLDILYQLGHWLSELSDTRVDHSLTRRQCIAIWWFFRLSRPCPYKGEMWVSLFGHVISQTLLAELTQDWRSLSVSETVDLMIDLSVHAADVCSRHRD